MEKHEKHSYNTRSWLVFLVIALIVTSFISFNLGKSSVRVSSKVDNTQQLQACITKNVSPLQAQAILDPSQYKQGTIEEVTNSCKALYPN